MVAAFIAIFGTQPASAADATATVPALAPAPTTTLAPYPTLARTWYASVYASRWADADLLDVPARSVTGDLDFEDAYFVGGGIARTLVRPFDIPLFGTGLALRNNRIEIEAQVLRHIGDQSHWEGTLALMFRFGPIDLPGGATVDIAVGQGLSYASERPRLEGSETVEPSQFLNYLVFEAQFTHASWRGISIVPRLHHRSGVYGLIAPRTSGSNFIGVGLRMDLN